MIVTARLSLKPPTLSDFDDSYAMFSDPAVMQFLGGTIVSREDSWNKLLRNVGHWQVFGYGIFTVREKAGNGFVGEVGLAHFARNLGERFDPFPEAAWILAASGHGKGYATEALLAAHDRMTEEKAPPRTVCIIHPDNTASLRVAEKLGYRSFDTAHYRGATPTMFERAAI